LVVVPVGATGTYTFLDETLYKDDQQRTIAISYRLTAKTLTGSVVQYANVSNSPTAVQRSWGSIKSMFR
jgi:hypothetical protein